MLTTQNLSLLPPVKLPAARKTVSSILAIHPLRQVWNHLGILVVSCSTNEDQCVPDHTSLTAKCAQCVTAAKLSEPCPSHRVLAEIWPYTASTKKLHWLSVKDRIQYKIPLLAYKAQHGMGLHRLSTLPYKSIIYPDGLHDLRANICSQLLDIACFRQALLCPRLSSHVEHDTYIHQVCQGGYLSFIRLAL